MPVLFLAGTNDRAIIACIRSMEAHKIQFYICLPEPSRLSIWKLSKYSNRVLDKRYDSTGDVELLKNGLEEAVKDIRPLVLFPTGETVIRILLQDPNWLRDNNIAFPVVDYKTYKRVSDKAAFADLVVKYDIYVPPLLENFPDSFSEPFVAKPKVNVDDHGNKKVPYLILSEKDFLSFNQQELLDNFFYQKYIDGYSIYYCAIYKNGLEQCSFVQKTLRQQPAGKSVFKACPTTIDRELRQKILTMMLDIRWNGVIMIEFKIHGGRYYMIEANPRFWGPLQLCVDNGYDFPYYLYLQAINNDYEVDKHQQINQFGYRWSLGYLNGLINKISSGGEFQEANPTSQEKKLKYRDVWLRKDTWGVYLLEFCIELVRLIRDTVRKVVIKPPQ